MQALFQSVRRSSCGKSSGSLHSSRYLWSNSIFLLFICCFVLCSLYLCDIISSLHSTYTDEQDRSSMHMRVHTCTLTVIQTWLVLSIYPNCVLESFPKQAQEHKVYWFYNWTLVAELKGLTPPIPKPITKTCFWAMIHHPFSPQSIWILSSHLLLTDESVNYQNLWLL